MADRVRLLVAALFDAAVSAELDGVRRALADASLGRIPSHVTLAPPTNVAASELPAVVRRLRVAAASVGAPIPLRLGPGATFAPANRAVYLAVDAPPALAALRDQVDVAPFGRDAGRPFVPHVTVARPPAELVGATVAALGRARFDAAVDAVSLLREAEVEGIRRRWLVVADAAFRPVLTMGVGSLPVELWFGTVIEPELLADLSADTPPSHPVVVTATRGGEPVGVAAGRPGEEPDVWWVRPPHRRTGVGSALRRAYP
jgi:2'-5' RNA ligase